MLGMKKWRFFLGLLVGWIGWNVGLPLLRDSGWVPTTPYIVASCALMVILGSLCARGFVKGFAERWKTRTLPSARKGRNREFVLLALWPFVFLLVMSPFWALPLFVERDPLLITFEEWQQKWADRIDRHEARGWDAESIQEMRDEHEAAWRTHARSKEAASDWSKFRGLPFLGLVASYCISVFLFRSMLPELDADEATDGT